MPHTFLPCVMFHILIQFCDRHVVDLHFIRLRTAATISSSSGNCPVASLE